MNFSGIDRHGLPGKILRLPLRLIPNSAIVPVIQGPLRGRLWVVGSSNHGCWLGSYEYSKQKMFIKEVNQSDVVYDIGAHVGFYTLLSSKLVGERGRVISFEPFPANLSYLERHVSLNSLKNVQIVGKAVSNRSGKMLFAIGPTSSMGHLSDQESEKTIEVDTVELDKFIHDESLPIPNLIKVDIEGAEFEFCMGAQQLLKKHSVKIFMATHGTEVHLKCITFLDGLGYKLQSITDKPLETTDEIFAFKR